MAIQFVQSKITNSTGGATLAITPLAAPATQNNSLIVAVIYDSATTATLTCTTTGGTGTEGFGTPVVGPFTPAGSNIKMAVFSLSSVGAGRTGVTVTFTGTAPAFSDGCVWEVSGLTNAHFDKSAQAAGSTFPALSGSTPTLTLADEFAITFLGTTGGGAAYVAPWTSDGLAPVTVSAYGHQIVSSNAAISSSGPAGSGNWGEVVATFMDPLFPALQESLGFRQLIKGPRSLHRGIKQGEFVTITGTSAVTEAADTLAATGTVLVTGTATPTEAADTLSSAGTVLVTGTLNVTEAADTLSAAGTVLVTGTLNVTEAADTLSATGTNGHVGSLTITEADDTLSAAGTVLVTGTLSITEAGDAIVSAGTILVTGTLNKTEAADTLSSAGTVLVTGSLSVTEASDAISSAGTVLVTGTLNVAEDPDTLLAAGTTTGAVTGTLSITEAGDTLASTGIAAQAPPVTPPAPTGGGGGGVGRLAGPKEYVYDEDRRPKPIARKGAVIAREANDGLVATGTVSWDGYDDEFMAVMMMAA